MTNPTNAPRWIPAADKEGGLVFGDVVRSPKWFRTNPDLVVLRINPHGTACVQCEQGTNYCGGIKPDDLLVRIDEPLPESTDAFRRGVSWSISLLSRYVIGESMVTDRDAGFRDALEYLKNTAREHGHIPTPTEAADGE